MSQPNRGNARFSGSDAWSSLGYHSIATAAFVVRPQLRLAKQRLLTKSDIEGVCRFLAQLGCQICPSDSRGAHAVDRRRSRLNTRPRRTFPSRSPQPETPSTNRLTESHGRKVSHGKSRTRSELRSRHGPKATRRTPTSPGGKLPSLLLRPKTAIDMCLNWTTRRKNRCDESYLDCRWNVC